MHYFKSNIYLLRKNKITSKTRFARILGLKQVSTLGKAGVTIQSTELT